MKVIVVGAGIMGLCTAWALTRAGHEPVVFEQGDAPNPMGSSFDQHRMTRFFYGDLPEYGPMVDEAFAAYDRLWADLGESHYVETGVLGLSRAAGDWTDLGRILLEREGRDITIRSPEALQHAYPFLALEGVNYGVEMLRGGILRAEKILKGLLRILGPAVHTHQRIESIDTERAEVRLADGTRSAADRLVVAAGPWTGQLIPELAPFLRSYRQVSVYLAPPAEFADAWADAPAIVDFGGENDLYAFPPAVGTDLKIGAGIYKAPGSPDRDREVAADEPASVFALFRDRLTRARDYRTLAARSCCYTMTADRRFVIKPLSPRAWVASPCSGHGFKFGAAIGLRLAGAVSGESDPESVTSWAAGRPFPAA